MTINDSETAAGCERQTAAGQDVEKDTSKAELMEGGQRDSSRRDKPLESIHNRNRARMKRREAREWHQTPTASTCKGDQWRGRFASSTTGDNETAYAEGEEAGERGRKGKLVHVQ